MLGLDLMLQYVFFSLHDVYALLTRDNYAKYGYVLHYQGIRLQ